MTAKKWIARKFGDVPGCCATAGQLIIWGYVVDKGGVANGQHGWVIPLTIENDGMGHGHPVCACPFCGAEMLTNGTWRTRQPFKVRYDAQNARLNALSDKQRAKAIPRASCSFSTPQTAVQRGGRIEGDEVVWPDGERYLIDPMKVPT